MSYQKEMKRCNPQSK